MTRKKPVSLKVGETRYAYDLVDRCIHCGLEFGDHSAKYPHGAVRRNGLLVGPPCGGFGTKESEEAKAKEARVEMLGSLPPKGIVSSGARLRNPWSALS